MIYRLKYESQMIRIHQGSNSGQRVHCRSLMNSLDAQIAKDNRAVVREVWALFDLCAHLIDELEDERSHDAPLSSIGAIRSQLAISVV